MVMISNSAIVNNTSAGVGGGIFEYFNSNLTLVNCTLANNSAGDRGGAIENYAPLTLVNCTVSNNSAFFGGGIQNAVATSVTLGNTIVAGNTDTIGNPDVYGVTAWVSEGHNLIGNTNGSSGWVGSDLTGTSAQPLNPLLALLGNYGGPTQTLALLPGSPAIDAGNNTLIPSGVNTDQRGLPRIVEGTVDIGAFESGGFTIAVQSGDNQSTVNGTVFANPLSVSVAANNPIEPVAGGVITYTVNPSGGGAAAMLSNGTATIAANGTASITATANSSLGSYTVSASATGAASPATFNLNNDETPSLVVTTTQDVVNPFDGLTSLREAINYAETLGGNPTITFAAGVTGTITLTGGQLNINQNLSINDPGANIIISGNNAGRVFAIGGGASVFFSGLTITGGSVPGGLGGASGGDIENSGTLTISDCTISGGSASLGGGIHSDYTATLIVSNSTFSGNTGYDGGGLESDGTTTVTNSTFNSNNASNLGGAIFNRDDQLGSPLEGMLTLTNDTISGNTASAGGSGVYDYQIRPGGMVSVQNTIVAANTTDDVENAAGSVFTSLGNNLIGDTDGSTGFGVSGDLTGTGSSPLNPMLGPLANNGGPTQTVALLSGSPAINTGNNSGAPATDQRGVARPFGPEVDIGAFEAMLNDFLVSNTNDSGPGSLRQAILDSNASANVGGQPNLIQFYISGSGVQTITPASLLPAITTPVVIDGYSQPGTAPNTLATGDNAVLLIQLDGATAGPFGLQLLASSSTIQGLDINNVPGDGILVTGSNDVIRGNMLDANSRGIVVTARPISYTPPAPPVPSVVTNNTIGGTTPADRNVISGNLLDGVLITGDGLATDQVTGNIVEGNLIESNGTSPHENDPGLVSSDVLYPGNNAIEITNPAFTFVSSGSIAGNVATVQPGASVTLTGTYTINSNGLSGAIIQLYNSFISPAPLGAAAQAYPYGGYYQGVPSAGITSGTFTLTLNAPPTPGTYFIAETFSFQFNFIPNKVGGFGMDVSTGLPAAPFEVIVLPPPLMAGVRIDNGATDNLVADNTIDANGKGVVVAGNTTTGNSILNNSIFGNTSLGIDLGDNGVTPNGTAPPGPNDFQNHPVLTTATSTSVSGYLLGTPMTNFDIQLFVSPASGPAEQGEQLLQDFPVTTNSSGMATFNLSGLTIAGGEVVTATATNDVTHDTSEFSPGPPVSIQVTGGDNQNTTVGTAFTAPLQATVEDAYGNPTPGISVSFAAPAVGASATFNNSTPVTNNNGVVSVTATAGTVSGNYNVNATVSGVSTPTIFSETNNPAAPSQLVVMMEPSTTATAGVDFAIQPVVAEEDQFGNIITTDSTPHGDGGAGH